MTDSLENLQAWFAQQCDGTWEHQRGVKIETLDNPGWSVEIDLEGTSLENKTFKDIDLSRNNINWIRCRVQKGRFQGFGGPENLNEILQTFLVWSSS